MRDAKKDARQNPTPPRRPFFKDEKLLHGTITVALSIRVLLVAVVVFVLVVVGGMFYLANQNSRVDRAVATVDDTVKRGRADRLKNQKQLRDSLAEQQRNLARLACFIETLLDPTDAEARRVIARIEEKYGPCADLAPSASGTAPRSGSGSSAPSVPAMSGQSGGASPSGAASAAPVPNGTSSATGGARSPRPRSSASVAPAPPAAAPQPSRTPPAASPEPTSTPPLLDLGGTTCALLGICLNRP